jgi:hypothetical protein
MSQISEIAMLRPDYVVAYTTGAVQIRLGALDRLDERQSSRKVSSMTRKRRRILSNTSISAIRAPSSSSNSR